MKVAFVHEWLAARAGSEKVLEAMIAAYPDAPIHALIHDARHYIGSPIGERRIVTSFVQRLPFARTRYRAYLPLMPLAVEQFDLSAYDLVISSHHAVAKGVLTRPDQLHVSYVHTPLRYAWDLQHQYLADARLGYGPRGLMARAALHYLRLWDRATAPRVDVVVANSRHVAARIRKAWGREAEVVHPPVEVARFRHDRPRDDFFLTVSRAVPYKRLDLIVTAFNRLGLPLVVIGGGPGVEALRRLAKPNVRVLGEQGDLVVADHLERCRAFVFAAEEDFGIAPVEAQAAGAPVIAYGRGGARETVLDGRTGLWFAAQTPESLAAAVSTFDASRFSADQLRQHAETFAPEVFRRRFAAVIERAWTAFAATRWG